MENEGLKDQTVYPTYSPSVEETDAINQVLKNFINGRLIISRNYSQFNGRNLYSALDDWTKRWNGYISEEGFFQDYETSKIFLNFTRNQIISYLSKVAAQPPSAKIIAINKKTGLMGQKIAEICRDLIKYSDDCENAPARFLEAALEATTKGTVIVYEGYARDEQEMKVPDDFDPETGKVKWKKEKRVVFDNCYRKIVPIEDFYISNPYQPDVQKQPWIIWREVTTYSEGQGEYGHYDNWKYVQPGAYTLTVDPTTFYRNRLRTELNQDQVEILRYYNRRKNAHVITVNGVVLYNGSFPWKDGMYPFAKGIFEPYGNDFFWGAGFAQKIQGDQDLLNTLWNMMIDKTKGSLLPYGLSSDLDDLIEDQILAPNKIRKVGDINKWKFDSLPGVTGGEQAMLQFAQKFAVDNSGNLQGGSSGYGPAGGRLTARQILLQQQEAQQKIAFASGYLEDLERDRVRLRLSHILQFYSIPRIEKITGKKGKQIEQLLYRDVKLSNYELSNGQKGTKIIKLVGSEANNPDEKQKLADQLSVTETMGEMQGIPTEALAIVIDTFHDFNYDVEVVRNSSFMKNQALDQAMRHEFATWRLQVAPLAPVDAPKLVEWVQEAYDIDTDEFTPEQPQQSGQGPKESISLNYKDVPPDIQRQMEAAAGFKPSGQPQSGLPGMQSGQMPSQSPQMPQGQVTSQMSPSAIPTLSGKLA